MSYPGKGKNVLITGGAGFLGSHVTDRAMREGYNVWVVDNLYTGDSHNFKHHLNHPRFKFIQHDVQYPYPSSIESIKFDFIFHLASPASPVHYQNDPIGTTMTCVNGTHNSLKTALRCNCPVLITSTSEVYGDPLVHPQPETYWGHVNCTGVRSCYDEGKRCAETLCFDYNRLYGVKIRVVRIFNTYGPRMVFNDGRIISNFLVQCLTGQPITIYGTGEYTRSFQYCDDLVEGFWRLINHPTETGPVNIGNPDEFSVLDMAKMIKEMTKSNSEIVFLEAAKDDPKQRKPDISKAKAVLGWEPKIKVQEGLRRTMEEFATRLARSQTSIRKLYVQCNPLLDISSHVDKAFLAKWKITAPAGLATDEQQGIYADIESRSDVVFVPGGSGLNTARVAQWMAQAPKQSFVTYVGSISDDARGDILKKSAESEGVFMAVQYSAKNSTGACAVCIVEKERYMVANLAAANDLKGEHLDTSVVKDAIKDAEFFYFTGFTLTLSVDYVLKVAKHAAVTGRTFSFNLSAPFIIQFFGEPLQKVLPYVDILFSNDEEAGIFATTQKWETTDTMEIAKRCAALPKVNKNPRLVIFTCGKNPTVWATTTASGTVAVDPIDPAKIIDTNGAGDSFVGGFLAAKASGATLEQSIRAGNYAAGVIIQHDGCTFPAKPSFTLVE
jgi:UDP-glucuronate decarboxylase